MPKYARHYSLTDEQSGNLRVFHHDCFTNGIVYADLVFDLPEIKNEDLYLVRLFTTLLAQVGCGGRSYVQNLEYIQAHTGGVGASLTQNTQARNFLEFHPSLTIRGKALQRKVNKLFPLLREMAESADFTDIHRLKEIILKHYVGIESSLNQNALKYAINLSASQLSPAAWISNTWYGLEYFWKIREIAQNIDHTLKPLAMQLQEMKEKLLGLENPHLVLSCDSSSYNELKTHQFFGLAHLETKPFALWRPQIELPSVPSQGRIIASPIAFTSLAFKTLSYTDPHAPALNIAAFLFDNLTLHTKVREKGGAYGGGASSNLMGGNFYFYSYRDPNISSTLAAFRDAIKEVVKGKFDLSDLEEAKLEMVQGLDSPVSPGSRADLAYGWLREGKTREMRQCFRERMLALSKNDVINAVKEIIVPGFERGATVVFAGKELLEKENEALKAKGLKPLIINSI